MAALEELDQQIDLSDDYESRITGSAAVGFGSKGSVIGETSSVSAAEEIPEAEFVAQTVLIKAAKSEIAAPTPGEPGRPAGRRCGAGGCAGPGAVCSGSTIR